MGQHTSGIPFTRTRGSMQGGIRPIAYVLTAAAASVVAMWGTLAHLGTGGLDFSSSLAMPIAAPAVADPPSPLITPVHRPTAAATATARRAAAVTRTSYTVMYGFDGGIAHLGAGARGVPELMSSDVNGGALRTVTHGSGDAIGFPARCADADCPRAILETVGDVDKLNPGEHRVSFGATIRMSHDQTSDGANVLQKGFATGGSEYKLQVDGVEGKPSCAVVGSDGPTIYVAKASVAIDDGEWHVVSCDLEGRALSLTVDGVARGSRKLPRPMNITNSDELRIGGKGTSTNNDQFNGELDDVWVTVGS
jgi:Concanavalin A-like lectin/glucanases superfamily